MFCSGCGSEIKDGVKFCPKCGKPVKMADSLGAKPPKKKKGGAGKVVLIILLILLGLCVLGGVGYGAYYFIANQESDEPEEEEGGRRRGRGNAEETAEETETTATTEGEPTTVGETEAATVEEGEETAAVVVVEEVVEEEEEEPAVTSDTYEVIHDVITDIPKATYAYSFDNDLGNSEVVEYGETNENGQPSDGKGPQVLGTYEAKYSKGVSKEAVMLDGRYGIKLSDASAIGNTYTISFWINPQEGAKDNNYMAPYFVSGNDLNNVEGRKSWMRITRGNGKAPFLQSGSEVTHDSGAVEIKGDYDLKMSEWQMVTIVVNSSYSKSNKVNGDVYLNGAFIASGDVVSNILDQSTLEMYLGCDYWDKMYRASYDEVRIWDQALDADTIWAMYDAYMNY